jgi:parallel beta-helix repeat protein
MLEEVNVYGDVINNHIHHQYFGFYSFGAFAMNVIGNDVHDNVQYGIDPHDDSDFLLIQDNNVHHNGHHGIICSRRCNNIRIINNISSSNGKHGIMLHRSVDHSLVEGNTVENNGQDGEDSHGGIVLFESDNNIIRNNIVSGNPNNIRISIGSSNNIFENNTLSNATRYGIYFFSSGSEDAPERCDGLPRGNTFKNNQILSAAQNIIRIKDSDKNLFRDNVINGSEIRLSSGRENMFINNTLSAGMILTLDADGDSTRASSAVVSDANDFAAIDLEAGSTVVNLGE